MKTQFEEMVMMSLERNIRAKANKFIEKGATWALADDGVLLTLSGTLILKISETFYKQHIHLEVESLAIAQ